MIYITGDPHGNFDRVQYFCEKHKTTKEDIMIILGDAGINYFGGERDKALKSFIESLPITFFCVHGNHEQRPFTIDTYKEKEFLGGIVYVEDEYPSINFAKDGEIFDFDGLQTIVIGGAYSIDKMYRLMFNSGWWPDEQPSDEIKTYVESQFDKVGWNIDIVLTHTMPLKYEPVEVFLPGVNQELVDKNTEEWLDKIEDKLQYKKWYGGHYHTEKKIDKIELMYRNFDLFGKWNSI